MAYTEKVSISGTALSFLLYECTNSNGQEGFLIGNVTSEVTNHISDSHSDSARLDTQIAIKSVLPLPSTALFYLPTGRVRDAALRELLAAAAGEIVGWYKYRPNSNIKPTFRDKLITKGLQKFFEKFHNRKHFVSCSLTNKTSASVSTHTFMYRFGKINCFNMYEYVEDITANLGEKLSGYKKPNKNPPHEVFNKIVKECNTEGSEPKDAILSIQEAVNARLAEEGKKASKYECTIRELEAEVKQMTTILSEKLSADLQVNYDKMMEEKLKNTEIEMVKACADALTSKPEENSLDIPNFLIDANHVSDSEGSSVQLVADEGKDRSPSPLLMQNKKPYNYAAALKKKSSSDAASSSKSSEFGGDLINFDVDLSPADVPVPMSDDLQLLKEGSPEY